MILFLVPTAIGWVGKQIANAFRWCCGKNDVEDEDPGSEKALRREEKRRREEERAYRDLSRYDYDQYG